MLSETTKVDIKYSFFDCIYFFNYSDRKTCGEFHMSRGGISFSAVGLAFSIRLGA
eukprot:GAHX01008577.1.p1 GENE.GAHX01008577.1~~GAHX01008577.1.p1  ORF type:complete len:55 (+),score=0.83 GAHX01008577.1:101-265(+)